MEAVSDQTQGYHICPLPLIYILSPRAFLLYFKNCPGPKERTNVLRHPQIQLEVSLWRSICEGQKILFWKLLFLLPLLVMGIIPRALHMLSTYSTNKHIHNSWNYRSESIKIVHLQRNGSFCTKGKRNASLQIIAIGMKRNGQFRIWLKGYKDENSV